MTNKNVWVVTIDLTRMDRSVLEYSKMLASHMKPEMVHFIHVIKEKTFSYLPDEFLEMALQVEVDKKLTMEPIIEKHFKGSGIPYACHVSSGTPFEEVISLVLNKSANLVIAGRKHESSGSGIVSDRLSRNLPCDFLLVTEGFEPKINKILVATDFSNHSILAMQRALNIQKNIEETEIIAHHSYKVPMGYSHSGKTYEEFADIIRGHAQQEMKRWLIRFRTKIRSTFKLQKDESLAIPLLDSAEEINADLIVIGSKGQSISTIALLGTNTMKLLKANNKIPMLIVKNPGENLKLIDAIRGL